MMKKPSTKIREVVKQGVYIPHKQNVIMSLGASGSVWELSDQNSSMVKSQSLQDRCSGLQVHLGAPGSTWERRRQSLEHRRQAWEHVESQ